MGCIGAAVGRVFCVGSSGGEGVVHGLDVAEGGRVRDMVMRMMMLGRGQLVVQVNYDHHCGERAQPRAALKPREA